MSRSTNIFYKAFLIFLFALSPSLSNAEEVSDAFRKVINEQLPMTPFEIREGRKVINETQKAANAPLIGEINPISRSVNVSLKPGSVMPVISLSAGNATAVTFSDITGSSWEVESVTNGNPKAFSSKVVGIPGKSNIIVITPLTPHTKGNLIITLADNPVPVPFILQSGHHNVDYRMDVRVQGRGPNAKDDIIEEAYIPGTNDKEMSSFLDGIALEGAKRLTSSNDKVVEAWEYRDNYYIRTKSTLLSPGYLSKSSNVSDTHIYVIQKTPIIQISQNGISSRISIREGS